MVMHMHAMALDWIGLLFLCTIIYLCMSVCVTLVCNCVCVATHLLNEGEKQNGVLPSAPVDGWCNSMDISVIDCGWFSR